MLQTDWIVEKSNPSIITDIETVSPISGLGSLRISQSPIAATVGISHTYLRVNAGPPQSKFLKGKIRTLIQPTQFTDTATSESFFGIYSMTNSTRPFETGGKTYCAGRLGGISPSWVIARVNNGYASVGDFTILSQGSVVNLPAINDIRSLEFEWIYDPILFQGVRLTLRASTTTNFSNMVIISQVIDTVGFLSSTMGEGLFLSTLHTTPGPIVSALFDRTLHFELVPTT
jgi:hypothetical protein